MLFRDLVMEYGASKVIDYHEAGRVNEIAITMEAGTSNEFAGIFDAISMYDIYAFDLQLIDELSEDCLATTHPSAGNVSRYGTWNR